MRTFISSCREGSDAMRGETQNDSDKDSELWEASPQIGGYRCVLENKSVQEKA